MHTSIPALLGAAVIASTAAATVIPFTEDFNANASNWRDAGGQTDLTWNATGSIDGGAFVSTQFSFVGNVANDTPVIARGQSNFGSSNNAFVGNWIADGVTLMTVSVRHNAPAPLTYFTRFASPQNFPGATAITFAPVLPNTWTTLTFPISANSPQFISFENTDFSTVFSNIGRLQLGVSVPGGLAGATPAFTFDFDKVSIVPAPASLALLGLGVMLRRRR